MNQVPAGRRMAGRRSTHRVGGPGAACRRLFGVALLGLLPAISGCAVSVHGMASHDQGGVYVAARRSFLGIPGALRVMHCEPAAATMACTRVMTGRQLGRALSRGPDKANPSDGDRPSPSGQSEGVEPLAVLRTPVAPADAKATLSRVQALLGRIPGDEEAQARDLVTITGLLRRGIDEATLLRELQRLDADHPDQPLEVLARLLVVARTASDFRFED